MPCIISFSIGEPKIASGIFVGESPVIQSQQIENCGVEVVEVHWVVDGFSSEFVGGAVAEAAFDAASGHPEGKAGAIVSASAAVVFVGAAAKLSALIR